MPVKAATTRCGATPFSLLSSFFCAHLRPGALRLLHGVALTNGARRLLLNLGALFHLLLRLGPVLGAFLGLVRTATHYVYVYLLLFFSLISNYNDTLNNLL